MDTNNTTNAGQIAQRMITEHANLAGSRFIDVSLAGSTFDDVNFSGATITNSNLSDWQVEDVNLSRLQITKADLSGACIVESLTDSMTIDGIAVADLMTAYRAVQKAMAAQSSDDPFLAG